MFSLGEVPTRSELTCCASFAVRYLIDMVMEQGRLRFNDVTVLSYMESPFTHESERINIFRGIN